MTARERVLAYLATRSDEARDSEEVTSFEDLETTIGNMTDARFHSTVSPSFDES